MNRILLLLTAAAMFAANLFGVTAKPIGGSDRNPPTNQATLFFENVGRIVRPVSICAAAVILLAFGLTYAGQTYGLLTAAVLLVALLMPSRFSPKLGLLSAARDTQERPGDILTLDVAAATKIYLGSLVAVDAAGNAKPATNTAGLTVIGRAEQTVDNTAGGAGDLTINVKRGVFCFANSATSALTKANLGTIAMVEDDSIVAIAASESIKAGLMVAIDSVGVWIDTRAFLPVVGTVADNAITGAKLADAVSDQIYKTTVAVANTGTPDGVAHITGQVQDSEGNGLAGRFLIRLFLDDAAYTAVEDLGTLTAAANSLILKETTDDAYADVLTHSDGSWGVDLDTAVNGTIHAHAAVVGQFATANAAITGNP